MSDVFISYSRKDKTFVQVLHQALSASKYNAWVDWQNIPITADWWAEIEAGIEAADTFIFVISPDAIASKVCRQEIDHAVNNNKRLVPIMRRPEFDVTLVHPALSKHNWLFFREQDDFEHAFGRLVEALNTDLSHVKTHTHLLVRSQEWIHKEHTPDLLLRGTQLEAILTWITACADKEPRLTAGQREYVAASSKAERDRQETEITRQHAEIERQKKARKTVTLALVGACIGFVGATVLGLVAIKQRQIVQEREINAQILAQSLKVENLVSSGRQIDALVEGLRGYQAMQMHTCSLHTGQDLRTISSLQQVLAGMVEQNRLEGHGDAVNSISFSPDGQTLASASSDSTIKLWTLQGEELITLEGHSDWVTQVRFSPDGQTLVSASGDGTVKLWTLQGEELISLEGHRDWVTSVSFSPDGQTLASASNDGTVKLWTLRGEELKSLEGHSGWVTSVSFSPDGQTLASASTDGSVKLWTLQGEELATLKGHSVTVNSVSFSPDSQTLASASHDGTVKLWTVQGEELITLEGHSDWVMSISFSPDGQTLTSASHDGTVKLWTIQGEVLNTLEGHNDLVTNVSFSPDGQTLASASADGTVKLWILQGDTPNTLEGHISWVSSVSFSPDGQILASASDDSTIKLWTLQGEALKTLEGHSVTVNSVSFSPDGQTLASASADGTVKLWTLEGEAVHTFAGHSNWVSSVSFSPDGQTLASTSADGTVKLWTLQGEELITLEGHSSWVNNVSFSPDGQTLASASSDSTIKLWTLQGEELITLEGHSDWVSNVSFSPDGETLASASGDGTVKLWTLQGKELNTLVGNSGSIYAVRFSPDGQTLASAGFDGTIALWNREGDKLSTLVGHRGAVTNISFSSDGQTLASTSQDRTIRLWNLNAEALVQKSCRWLHHYLITRPNVLGELTTCHTPERLQAAAPHLVQKAMQTASQGNTREAQQQLATALTWHPQIDLEPHTPEIDQDPAQIALKFTARHHRRVGQHLAEQLNLEAAVQAYEQALKLDATIDLAPDTEAAVEQDPANMARRFAALIQQGRGERRAKELKIGEAIQAFEEALALDPTIDLNPYTEESIEQDAGAIAHKFAAPSQIVEGIRQAENGEVQAAIAAYQMAQDLDSDIEITDQEWDKLCWSGAVHQQTKAVLFACEYEAALKPSADSTLDSRGIMLALNGDVAGAIANFQAYIGFVQIEKRKIQAQAWIDALKADQNPFQPY
ncbi:MAG: TIR domain-containing protein [Cyanobacteria bacterium J06639_14]